MKYDLMIIDMPHLMHRNFHGSASNEALDSISMSRMTALQDKERTDDENLEYASLFKEYVDNKIGLTIHAILASILHIMKKYPSKKVIFAWDLNSWRKDEFEGYKSARREKRKDDSAEDKYIYKMLYKGVDDLQELLSNTIHCNMKIDGCEADDIIGVLCKACVREKIIVITGDSDSVQILQKPNVSLFDPFKDKMVKKSATEAAYDLFFKIIRGDRSDSIPSAWPRVRETKIKAMFDDTTLLTEEHDKNPEFKKLFNRNKKLISFDEIPTDVARNVVYAYTSHSRDGKQFVITEWASFCKKYKLMSHMANIDRIKKALYEL